MTFMKSREWIKKFFLLTITVVFLYACSQGGDSSSSSSSDHDSSPGTDDGYLVEATSLGEVSADKIRQKALEAGFASQAGEFIKYSVKFYKIIYRTTYKGQSILASGLISYPTGISDAIPTMIVGNIQTYADQDAPSTFYFSDISLSFASIAAIAGSAGYLTVIPDMLGAGESKDVIAPMRNYGHAAGAMIDFIHASEEFIQKRKIQVNGKKFITGYSEGGYIALAALKMIEEKPVEGLTIEATSVGAGGYNLVNLLNKIIIDGSGSYSAPCDLALLIYSYNAMYDWNRPLTDFFQEPYAGNMPDLLSGKYTREEINTQLTESLEDLFNPVFLDNLKNNGETALISALNENSVDNWAPKGKLMLFHNRYDQLIPFSDTMETYQKMLFNGAQNVMLRDTSDVESHFDSATAFVIITSLWFDSMKQ